MEDPAEQSWKICLFSFSMRRRRGFQRWGVKGSRDYKTVEELENILFGVKENTAFVWRPIINI